MRMLTELERRAFVGTTIIESPMNDPEEDVEEELIRFGRAKWVLVDRGVYMIEPTFWGEKALRIDDIIRSLGGAS